MKKFLFWLTVLNLISLTDAQWFPLNSGTTAHLNGICVVDPFTVYVVGNGGIILRTTDGGLTWDQKFPVLPDLNDVAFCDINTGMAVGKNGIILKTTNGGNDWQLLNSGVTAALNGIWYPFSGSATICYGNSYLKTANGGTSWGFSTPFGYPYTYQLKDISYNNWTTRRGVTCGSGTYNEPPYFFIRSIGSSFDGYYWSESTEQSMYSFGQISVLPNGRLFAIVTYTGELFTKPQLSSPWELRSTPGSANDIFFVNNNFGTILQSNVRTTTDGGYTWTDVYPGSFRKVAFADSLIGYAIGVEGKIIKTNNAGVPVELTSFDASIDGYDVTLEWSTSSEINNSGFEVQRKLFDNWESLGFINGYGTTTEPHSYTYYDNLIKYEGDNLIFYRLKQIDLNGSFEFSKEVRVSMSSETYLLEQNYPNPFNPSTMIKYRISEDSHVQLSVYDALGNEISRLVNEKQKSGDYIYEFNGTELPSGTYFLKITSGTHSQVRKMLLMK